MFGILLDAHAFQFGINFDKNVEISTTQLIRSILHIKNNLLHLR
jgi:hypothetical protein